MIALWNPATCLFNNVIFTFQISYHRERRHSTYYLCPMALINVFVRMDININIVMESLLKHLLWLVGDLALKRHRCSSAWITLIFDHYYPVPLVLRCSTCLYLLILWSHIWYVSASQQHELRDTSKVVIIFRMCLSYLCTVAQSIGPSTHSIHTLSFHISWRQSLLFLLH